VRKPTPKNRKMLSPYPVPTAAEVAAHQKAKTYEEMKAEVEALHKPLADKIEEQDKEIAALKEQVEELKELAGELERKSHDHRGYD